MIDDDEYREDGTVQLLDVAAAAARAKKSARTISRWIDAGLLQPIQSGNRKLIPIDQLQAAIRNTNRRARARGRSLNR